MRALPRPQPENQSLVEVAWILQGCRAKWQSTDWLRYADTHLPPAAVGDSLRAAARSLVLEQAAAEDYRARVAFGLKN